MSNKWIDLKEWIDIEGEQPFFNARVWVCCRSQVDGNLYVKDAELLEDGRWFQDDGMNGSFLFGYDILCWQRFIIPELPELENYDS